MPRISKVKEDKIKETIIAFLFQNVPQALFTYHIAQETARDEEYIKKLMLDLEVKGIVASVKKNSQGADYTKRIRWRLTDETYSAYKNLNGNAPTIPNHIIEPQETEEKKE